MPVVCSHSRHPGTPWSKTGSRENELPIPTPAASGDVSGRLVRFGQPVITLWVMRTLRYPAQISSDRVRANTDRYEETYAPPPNYSNKFHDCIYPPPIFLLLGIGINSSRVAISRLNCIWIHLEQSPTLIKSFFDRGTWSSDSIAPGSYSILKRAGAWALVHFPLAAAYW